MIYRLLIILSVVSAISCGEDFGAGRGTPGILDQFRESYPLQFVDMETYGINAEGTLLCYRSKTGRTFFYSKKTGQIKFIDHGQVIGPGQVTNIKYKNNNYNGVFLLMSGDECILSIGASE